MKKILLISPDAKGLEDKTAYPPLGLLYTAANMDTFEPELHIMKDSNFGKFDYEYYGISVHSIGVVKETINIINQIKNNNNKCQIYVGGSAANLIERYGVCVVKGESEKYFSRANVEDLDTIKYPARHLLPEEYIRHTGKVHHSTEPSTTIIATRGCVYNCGFCDRTTLGRKFRKRSVYNIVGEIKEVQQKYGINWFRFIDDCITLDNRWFTSLCFELKHLGIKWTCLSRADLVNEKTLLYMKKSGCQEIFFGFESGSQKILDLMNKRIKVESNRKAIQMCKDVGMKSCAYMMFGFPGEDEVTVNETIKFLEESSPDKSRISTFIPIPNTDVWNNPDKYNVKIKDNFEDFWYFDKRDFALDYNYISQDKMSELRDRIYKYYEEKFKQGWVN